MAVLHIDPESSALVHAAANAVLLLHIGGGSLGIFSGFAALAFRKGEWMHRVAGTVFFVSMLTMSGIGALVAPFLPERMSSLAGFYTFYLVATAWMTVRRRENATGAFERIALVWVLGVGVAGVLLGMQAAASPDGKLDGFPAQGHYIIAGIAGLSAFVDWTVIARGGIGGAQRIARHVWRMCAALFVAAGSFFLGQAQLFPKEVRASNILLVPELVIIAAMIFWLLVTAFTRRFRSKPMTLSLAKDKP